MHIPGDSGAAVGGDHNVWMLSIAFMHVLVQGCDAFLSQLSRGHWTLLSHQGEDLSCAAHCLTRERTKRTIDGGPSGDEGKEKTGKGKGKEEDTRPPFTFCACNFTTKLALLNIQIHIQPRGDRSDDGCDLWI
jgi:hypothetical protein